MQISREELSRLMDLYSGLLTPRQRDMLELYYNEDLSLSEIAENTGITRQGVRNACKQGEKALIEFEKAIGLLRKSRLTAAAASEILEKTDDPEIKRLSLEILQLFHE